MGNFYTNITIRDVGQDQIVDYFTAKGRNAYVSPAIGGYTVVFDRETEQQEPSVIEALASDLSRQFECAVLAVLNHDDDIFWYQLYQYGRLIDEYNSTPGYFDPDAEPSAPDGGDAGKLCAAFDAAGAVEEVESILRTSSLSDEGYLFAVDRHSDMVKALRLPTCAVGTGYEYLEHGDMPQGLDPADLRRTGD